MAPPIAPCEEVDHLADLDLERWDASLGAHDFYASSTWLRIAADTADLPPCYLRTAYSDDQHLATLACYPMAADSPFPFCRAEFLATRFLTSCATGSGARTAASLMPALFLGGRNPAHTRIGTGGLEPGSDAERAVLDRLLTGAERAAAARGLRSVGMLYVDEDAAPLRQALTEHGYVAFPHHEAAVLTVPAGGFDAYARGAADCPLTANMRNNVRRERKRLTAAGVRYRAGGLDPAALATADRLEGWLNRKYGTFDDAAVRRLRERIAAHAGDAAGLEFADLDGRTVGSLLYFRHRDELYVRTVGFDYAATDGLPVYFGLLFYHLIERAARCGVRTVHYSVGSAEAKRRRGCRLVRQHAYVKGLAPGLHAAFADAVAAG
ncbi:GNAT family N-acetyltransferase [Streptomyces sp. 796.1]|uniref:GNAT family N-acetyltransferase n=1 Tax=Streptomyces sp. 796.1 TaxID=3163029 RepID=UPI0039C9E87F